MARYQWEHPVEWLTDRINNAGMTELRSIAREIASNMDGDAVQYLFQSEMDADGYFDDLDEAEERRREDERPNCAACGCTLREDDTCPEGCAQPEEE